MTFSKEPKLLELPDYNFTKDPQYYGLKKEYERVSKDVSEEKRLKELVQLWEKIKNKYNKFPGNLIKAEIKKEINELQMLCWKNIEQEFKQNIEDFTTLKEELTKKQYLNDNEITKIQNLLCLTKENQQYYSLIIDEKKLSKLQTEIQKLKQKAQEIKNKHKELGTTEDPLIIITKNLTEKQKKQLLENGYTLLSDRGLKQNGANEDILVKETKGITPKHQALIGRIQQYLQQKGIKHIELAPKGSEEIDLKFRHNKKWYGFDIETGSNNKQKITEKKKYQKEFENKWWIVVTDWKKAPKYKRQNLPVLTRVTVKTQIDKILK